MAAAWEDRLGLVGGFTGHCLRFPVLSILLPRGRVGACLPEPQQLLVPGGLAGVPAPPALPPRCGQGGGEWTTQIRTHKKKGSKIMIILENRETCFQGG